MKNNIPACLYMAMALLILSDGFVHFCEAAHISEIFLNQEQTDYTPCAVEIDGIVELSELQLVVVDAGKYLYGQVLNVIDIPVNQNIQLISQEPWPDNLWHCTNDNQSIATTLESIDYDNPFDFDGPRSLLLLDQSTQLREHANLFTDSLQQYYLNLANILDVVTFGPNAEAKPFGDEIVINASLGTAISRPYGLDGYLHQNTFLVGFPDDIGKLYDPTETEPYYVTPGVINPAWDSSHTPEVSALTSILALSFIFVYRRNRR